MYENPEEHGPPAPRCRRPWLRGDFIKDGRSQRKGFFTVQSFFRKREERDSLDETVQTFVAKRLKFFDGEFA